MMIDGVRAMDRATELVLRYCTAFNRGDADAMLGCLAEDVVHEANQLPRETGRVSFAKAIEHRQRCYREQWKSIVVMSNMDGAHAALEFVAHGEYLQQDNDMPAAHGQPYVLGGGAFFEIRDGQIARLTEYANREDWLRQVRA
ncbi:MAG: ketosteroid isomerase-related protein [Tahibacter sp.]